MKYSRNPKLQDKNWNRKFAWLPVRLNYGHPNWPGMPAYHNREDCASTPTEDHMVWLEFYWKRGDQIMSTMAYFNETELDPLKRRTSAAQIGISYNERQRAQGLRIIDRWEEDTKF